MIHRESTAIYYCAHKEQRKNCGVFVIFLPIFSVIVIVVVVHFTLFVVSAFVIQCQYTVLISLCVCVHFHSIFFPLALSANETGNRLLSSYKIYATPRSFKRCVFALSHSISMKNDALDFSMHRSNLYFFVGYVTFVIVIAMHRDSRYTWKGRAIFIALCDFDCARLWQCDKTRKHKHKLTHTQTHTYSLHNLHVWNQFIVDRYWVSVWITTTGCALVLIQHRPSVASPSSP